MREKFVKSLRELFFVSRSLHAEKTWREYAGEFFKLDIIEVEGKKKTAQVRGLFSFCPARREIMKSIVCEVAQQNQELATAVEVSSEGPGTWIQVPWNQEFTLNPVSRKVIRFNDLR